MNETPAPPPFLIDRHQVALAATLIVQHGVGAAAEAAARAGRSRRVGNTVHFCRWRQVERLIDVLATGRAIGTLH